MYEKCVKGAKTPPSSIIEIVLSRFKCQLARRQHRMDLLLRERIDLVLSVTNPQSYKYSFTRGTMYRTSAPLNHPPLHRGIVQIPQIDGQSKVNTSLTQSHPLPPPNMLAWSITAMQKLSAMNFLLVLGRGGHLNLRPAGL